MRDARVPGASSAFNSSGSKRTYSSLVNSDPFTVSSQGTISDHDSGLPYCYTTKVREPGDQARPVGRATRPGQGLAGGANLRHVRVCPDRDGAHPEVTTRSRARAPKGGLSAEARER